MEVGCGRWRWLWERWKWLWGGGWEVEVGVEEVGEGKYENLTMQIEP